MQPNSYRALSKSLAAAGLSAQQQRPEQLVVSCQEGPVWPDRGNSFWLSHKEGAWYLSTWAPVGYGIPADQDIVSLCIACMAFGDSAMGRVPSDLVLRFQLRELADSDYSRLFCGDTRYEKQLPFRFHVGLRVSSRLATLDEITAMLGLFPHDSSLKGEVPNRLKKLDEGTREIYAREHQWAASFEPLTSAESLNECLTRAAAHLAKHSDELLRLSKSGNVNLYIHAYPGAIPEAIDWSILDRIRSDGSVGLQIHLSSRLETSRPIDEKRPKNHS